MAALGSPNWRRGRRGRRGRVKLRRDHHADQQRDDLWRKRRRGQFGKAAQAAPGYGTRAPSGRWSTAERSKAARGGKGSPNGAAGDAIYSAGAHASIGPITNSGQIIGNVEIDNQASVTVTGGAGKTFGSWTGGAITIGAGNLTFAGGNTALGDDIAVDGGKGTVTNKGRLQIATRRRLPSPAISPRPPPGVLGLDFAGDVSGQYGALAISASHDARRRPRDRPDQRLHAGERRQLRHPRFRQPHGRLRRACARRRGLLIGGRWICGPAAEACV